MYTAYKWFAIVIGFSTTFLLYVFLVRGYEYDSKTWWWPVLFLGVPTIIIISRALDYFSIEDKNLVLNRFFWKKKIPIANLQELSYEGRLADHILVIKYLEDGALQTKETQVRIYNTQTLEAMNTALRNSNSNLSISVDEGAQKYMEQGKLSLKQTPVAFYEWFFVFLKYFVLSSSIVAIFLWLAFRNQV